VLLKDLDNISRAIRNVASAEGVAEVNLHLCWLILVITVSKVVCKMD